MQVSRLIRESLARLAAHMNVSDRRLISRRLARTIADRVDRVAA
jgi:hypothetical protein